MTPDSGALMFGFMRLWLLGMLTVSGIVALPTRAFPRFDRVLLLETTSETSANASIADLNGDGNLDIVLVKGRHWPLRSRILLGDGKGAFPTVYDLDSVAYRSYSGRLADLDGDGDLDIVLSNDAPSPKVTYLNDGTGRFSLGSTFGRPEWPTRNAAVADLNGDGRPDIVAANRADTGRANYICLNRGEGRFDSDCAAFSHESATTITAADINRDGLTDLVVPNRDGGQSYIYLAGPGGTYSDAKRLSFGPYNAAIRVAEAADLDGDLLLDIVAIDERRGATVFYGAGGGGFAPGVALETGRTPYALTLGDLDRDGRLDIVVGHVEAPSMIHFNLGGRRYSRLPFGDTRGTVYGFAIADLDGNGISDIVAARSEAPNVVYFGDR